MTMNAAPWFYGDPERAPYLLGERVRNAFWAQRFGGLWLEASKTDPPFRVEGTHNGAQVALEWEPRQWLRLTSAPPAPALAQGITNILGRRPTLRFEDGSGRTVWEWWVAGADKRWQEIQGKPAFRNPKRLDAAE